MTPQLKKIVWNGARTTGNPVYPHGGSSFHVVLSHGCRLPIVYVLLHFDIICITLKELYNELQTMSALQDEFFIHELELENYRGVVEM